MTVTASLRERLDKGKEDEFILVVDLGGGTFDMFLLEVGRDEDGFLTLPQLPGRSVLPGRGGVGR